MYLCLHWSHIKIIVQFLKQIIKVWFYQVEFPMWPQYSSIKNHLLEPPPESTLQLLPETLVFQMCTGSWPNCCTSDSAPWKWPWKSSGRQLDIWVPATHKGDLGNSLAPGFGLACSLGHYSLPGSRPRERWSLHVFQ